MTQKCVETQTKPIEPTHQTEGAEKIYLICIIFILCVIRFCLLPITTRDFVVLKSQTQGNIDIQSRCLEHKFSCNVVNVFIPDCDVRILAEELEIIQLNISEVQKYLLYNVVLKKLKPQSCTIEWSWSSGSVFEIKAELCPDIHFVVQPVIEMDRTCREECPGCIGIERKWRGDHIQG